MKKRQLAEVMAYSTIQDQVEDATVRNLAEIIGQSFSAIGTIDPAFALDVLKQLNSQKTQLDELVISREEQFENLSSDIMSNLPDSMEFEDELEQ